MFTPQQGYFVKPQGADEKPGSLTGEDLPETEHLLIPHLATAFLFFSRACIFFARS